MSQPHLPTPSTAAIISLLDKYPRRQILKTIDQCPDPQAALLAGDVAKLLEQTGRARKKSATHLRHASSTCAVVGYFDAHFPPLLKSIPDPPLLLYYRGALALLHQASAVAVVGARQCTSAGRLLAQQIARDLASHGITVVSGLALGIDGAAHRGALSAAADGIGVQVKSGLTVAVLGSGLNRIYPERHRQLASEIVAADGLLLSEYPPLTGPRAHHFPERNRLISGVCGATVVIEAGEKSGSLITARLGLEQGRDVMAVPGPVSSRVSAGCHRLIQQGAALVTNAEDVLLALGVEATVEENLEQTDDFHESLLPARLPSAAHHQVLDCIQGLPVTLDEVCLQTGLTAGEVSALLVSLELLGFVQQVQLGYIRSPSCTA
jgi:DNA processing protein